MATTTSLILPWGCEKPAWHSRFQQTWTCLGTNLPRSLQPLQSIVSHLKWIVSLGLKLRRPLTLSLFSYGLTALAILAIPSPRPSTISSGERRTSVLFGLPVYPLSCVSCCCPERSFFSLISSGCFICRLLGAGFCLRDGNVKHLIRVLSEPNHGLEKHHATLVSSSDSLLQDLEMGTRWGFPEWTLWFQHTSTHFSQRNL